MLSENTCFVKQPVPKSLGSNLTEDTMTKSWPPMTATFFASLFLSATLGCGSGGSSRQLQSIAVNGTGMIQMQFTATGTFTVTPTTVSPLPVSWYVVNPVPSGMPYLLTSQPFEVTCENATLVAVAPADPTAPPAAPYRVKSFRIWLSRRPPRLKEGLSLPVPSFSRALSDAALSDLELNKAKIRRAHQTITSACPYAQL